MMKSWRNYVKSLELSGEKWLKVTGIILLSGACLSAISLFFNASQIGQLLEGETKAVRSQYDWLWIIWIVSFSAVIVRFLAGLAGISYCRDTKKAKTCMRFGIAMLIIWIVGLVITAVLNAFSPSSLLGFVIPFAYLVGATKNDEENGVPEVEKGLCESVSGFVKNTCKMAKQNKVRCIVICCAILGVAGLIVAISIIGKTYEKDSLVHGEYMENIHTYEAVAQDWDATFNVTLVTTSSEDEWLFSFSDGGIQVGKVMFYPEDTHTLSGDYEIIVKDKAYPNADDSCTLSFTRSWYQYKGRNWHEKTLLEITTNNPTATIEKLTGAGLDISKIKNES